jgi:PTH1 family peptidyl-tRNA hydrolase
LWCIAGLGNYGRRYSRTRHNIGFMVVEEIAGRLGLELKERKHYMIARGSMEDGEAVLIEPLTFMNRSGTAVKEALKRSGIPPGRLIVIHDDMDMETGRLKLRKSGSSGGHKGIQSIIESIGTNDFIRVKIGIGRDEEIPPEKFVLTRFTRAELPAVREAVKTASEAVGYIMREGIESAMNRYNRKPPKSPAAP